MGKVRQVDLSVNAERLAAVHHRGAVEVLSAGGLEEGNDEHGLRALRYPAKSLKRFRGNILRQGEERSVLLPRKPRREKELGVADDPGALFSGNGGHLNGPFNAPAGICCSAHLYGGDLHLNTVRGES